MAVNKPSPVSNSISTRIRVVFQLTGNGQVLYDDKEIGIGGVERRGPTGNSPRAIAGDHQCRRRRHRRARGPSD